MKKIWSTYSYTILLILASCLFAFILSLKTEPKEEYLIVTVASGDTLWELAEEYSHNSHLSKKQFVNWVLTKNNISEKALYPGEEIVLPIKKNTADTGTEIASAIGE